MFHKQPNDHAPGSPLHVVLTWVVVLGACLVVLMAGVAFGPSGSAFGLVVAVAVFWLMVRRYRFSLRTFLLATTVFGIWLGLKVGHDLRTQQALTEIAGAGGRLKIVDRRPNFPWGIWANKYSLDFYGIKQPLTDEAIAALEALAPSSLQRLDVENTGLTDERLKSIGQLTGLQSLNLGNRTYLGGGRIPGSPQNRITDAGVAQLRRLRGLTNINLSGTDITDECITHLLEMPRLKCVYLDGTKVTAVGISRLNALKELWLLELNGCPITADGFYELSKLRNVKSLALSNTSMTDADLDKLNAMVQLTNVLLWKVNVSDEALTRFSDAHPGCRIQRLE